MFCEFCGTKNEETAKFCEGCGHPLHHIKNSGASASGGYKSPFPLKGASNAGAQSGGYQPQGGGYKSPFPMSGEDGAAEYLQKQEKDKKRNKKVGLIVGLVIGLPVAATIVFSVLVGVLAGIFPSSKITQSNFYSVEVGMTMQEVTDILGDDWSPFYSEDPNVDLYTWYNDDITILVYFENNRVIYKELIINSETYHQSRTEKTADYGLPFF